MSNENMSWSDVAERHAAGFCPSSPDYDQPHIVTDGATCDECGADVSTVKATQTYTLKDDTALETPDTLNARMEFEHVIYSDGAGNISSVEGVYAPSAYQWHAADGTWPLELEQGDKWTLLGGFSGQYRYSGPWMHSSEYIGGGMAREILETAGVYVAIFPSILEGEHPDDDPENPGESDTWAVVRLNGSEAGE